jgi:hypothetical protein
MLDSRIAAGAQAAIAHDMNDEIVTVGDALHLFLYWAGVAINEYLKHSYSPARGPYGFPPLRRVSAGR